MKKLNKIILVLSLFGYGVVTAQSSQIETSDSLFAYRKAFTTHVYKNTQKLSDEDLTILLKPSPKWSKKFQISRVLLPAGPVVAAGGVLLAYDALKGTPMVAEIDGKVYPYTVRSLPKLLSGIAIFVGGMSMIESANETKSNAVKWFNGNMSTNLGNHNVGKNVELRFGIQDSGNVGLAMKF